VVYGEWCTVPGVWWAAAIQCAHHYQGRVSDEGVSEEGVSEEGVSEE
jgi:hypothetical protein